MIADYLRRAHLIDGVPWSQMAVIVRSVPRGGAGLPHALARAGVPVAAVGARRSVGRAARGAGVVDGAGRDCRRAGRRAGAVVADRADRSGRPGLASPAYDGHCGATTPTDSPTELRRPAGRGAHRGHACRLGCPRRRPGRCSGCARCWMPRPARHRRGEDPRYTLWAAWQRSGLQRRWLTACERGGPAGAQAGRDLDAVTALFDVADQYLSRTAGASLPGLIDHLCHAQLPAAAAEAGSTASSVAVLSAHAALGQEWDLVVIAGLQEGLWPNTDSARRRAGHPAAARRARRGRRERLDARAAARRGATAAGRRDGARPHAAAGDRRRRRNRGPATRPTLPSPFFSEIAQWTAVDADARLPRNRSSAPRVLSADGGGRPPARRGVRAAGRGRRRRAPLCRNAIGAAGRSRRAGRRPRRAGTA